MEPFHHFLSSDDNKVFDIHIHNTYELNFIDSHNPDIVFENMHFPASAGDVFIFPPFSFHGINARGEAYKRHVSLFSAEDILSHSSCSASIIDYIAQFKPFYVHLNEEQCKILREMISDNIAKTRNPSKWYYFDAVYSLCNIVKFVAQIHLENGGQNINFTKSDNNKISLILKYIHENYTYDLSIEEVARKFKMSKSTLFNTFKEYIGFSFKEYLIRLRLAKSMALLKKGLSVTETANLSGFNSYAHFIRTFSSRIGISPKKYALEKSANRESDYLRYWEA